MEQGGHARAVFVDPTGRRQRRVARVAWLLAGLGTAYVALVVVSLLLPPSLTRLSVPGLGQLLPGPAAAPLGQAEGEADGPDVLLGRSPSPAPARPTALPRPSRSAPPATASPLPRVTTAPAAAPPRPAPGPAPTTARPTPAATGRPATAPTQASRPSDPPGQASRSPKPRPSPSRGPR